MTEKIWIVAADASRARIFTTSNSRRPLQELEDMLHPEGRAHGRDIDVDEPGLVYESHGQGRHTTETTRKDEEANAFARRICERLKRARLDGECEKLYLVAPPQFLGVLRDNLDRPTQGVVAGEITKDVVTADPERVREVLPYAL